MPLDVMGFLMVMAALATVVFGPKTDGVFLLSFLVGFAGIGFTMIDGFIRSMESDDRAKAEQRKPEGDNRP